MLTDVLKSVVCRRQGRRVQPIQQEQVSYGEARFALVPWGNGRILLRAGVAMVRPGRER